MKTIIKKDFPVLKLSCASCANSSESILKAQEGVLTANVNYANAMAHIEYDADKVSPSVFKQALQSIGYDLMIDESEDADSQLEDEKKSRIKN